MKLEIPGISQIQREMTLKKAHHNVQILPSELVPYDLATDSLQHHPVEEKNGKKKTEGWLAKPVFLEFQKLVKELFGFPYSIPLAQGRMAEALLSKLLVRNGCVIPTNMPFPTTRLHQELNGGRSIEAIVPEAYEHRNSFPFKGNIDLSKLEELIRHYSPRWIPYVSLEACVNGAGGQPFSLENLKAVSALTCQHGIRLFLDACRILENAYQIQRQESTYRDAPVWDIAKQICSYADGLTMSFTKDFPVTIGGMVAFRDEALYQEGFDFVMAMGDGLSLEAKGKICDALRLAKIDTSFIEKRMHLVKILWEGLTSLGVRVLQPAGGHAILLDLKDLLPHLSEADFPAESLNHTLYLQFGIRGTPHLASALQQEKGMILFRLAVPILGYDEIKIQEVVRAVKNWNPLREKTLRLKRVYVPAGLSGEFRAWYEL